MKILGSPFGQFKKHHFGSADMCSVNQLEVLEPSLGLDLIDSQSSLVSFLTCVVYGISYFHRWGMEKR